MTLQEAEAQLQALTGGRASEAERAARALRRRAEHDGGLCGVCGRELQPGEAVYRRSVSNGRTFMGGWSRCTIPSCRGCIDAERERLSRYPWSLREFEGRLRRQPQTPCVGCGRPVVNLVAKLDRLHTVCSDRCAWTARNRALKVARAAARHKTCTVCGEAFDAPRTDAVTCSPACRQKAYRARRVPTAGR